MKFSEIIRLTSVMVMAMQVATVSSSQCVDCECTCGGPGQPACSYNLVPMIEDVFVATENFRKRDCAVVEGSLGNEICEFPTDFKGSASRTLLKFSTGVWNKG